MAGAAGAGSAQAEEVVWSARAGAHLEAARKQAGLRRIDLAYQMGVTEETIRLWEKGATHPSVERLARLIAILSLETSEWPARQDLATADLPPLAARLRHERDSRAITQAEAVKLLGVPQATYAGWETGRTTPGAQLYGTLAAFLGIAEQDVATLCSTPFVVDTAGWPPFGQFVGARRQELRLTRGALADAVGVSQGTVVAWELGYRVPGATQLPRLASVLAVEVSSLTAALPKRTSASSLGELILSRQRDLGLRSVDIARSLGSTEATVSRWINGRSQPAVRNLRRLAEVLKVPYENIIEAAGAPA
jgi:transcriptional regulator with XRE-family HTH domain